MYRIVDKKNSGKTSNLLLLAKEYNGVIVCRNPDRIREKALSYGICGLTYYSYEDYMLNKDKIYKPVFIDEIEFFISYVTANNLVGYTYSLES